MKSQEWGPNPIGLVSLSDKTKKKHRDASLSTVHYVKTQGEGSCTQIKERALTRNYP